MEIHMIIFYFPSETDPITYYPETKLFFLVDIFLAHLIQVK